jgi:hypothetical protein
MENNPIFNVEPVSERIDFLLENIDKLPLFLSKDQIQFVVSELKKDLTNIEKIIEVLKKEESSGSEDVQEDNEEIP